MTQVGKDHDVIYVKNDNMQELRQAKGAQNAALGGMMAVLGFFLLLACGTICFLGKKAKDLNAWASSYLSTGMFEYLYLLVVT